MSTSLPNKAQTGFLADLIPPWFKFLCRRMLLKNNIKKDIIKILLCILHYGRQAKEYIIVKLAY